MMSANILLTKLYPPFLPGKRVQRPHLVQRLNAGLQAGRGVTLVSAPAGFGKTVCVSEWLSSLDCPVAWLSLDPADDDPGRFFTYLIAALQKVNENLGKEIEGVLRAGQLPPAEIISATLINDILGGRERFLLVLDDFQVIQDSFILGVIEQLATNLFLANLSQPLRLALVTREDPSLPLARLRANNKLTEIRAADLRFSNREAGQFLNEVMGLSLSQADVEALEGRTEGWVVGLHLAGLSIRDRPDPSQFITNLSGSHRFILSYLTEEVLNQQEPEIREFLLQTSILDRLSGDLCNAVAGRADSHALLERLFNDNLFLVPLDDEGRWYRYHQLFADLLRDLQDVQQKNSTAELHRRASRWYAQSGTEGERAAFVSQSIQHALAAEDYAMAVSLFESHALNMLMQWHIKTVNGWMEAIPPEWCLQSPRAVMVFAWMYLLRGNFPQAFSYLERLQAMFSDPRAGEEDYSLKARWFALQSMLLNAQGQPEQSLELAKRALEIVPQEDGYVRSMIYTELATAYQRLDNGTQAMWAFQMIIQDGRAMGNLASELLGISGLALLAIQRGQYHFAFEIASQGIERMERSGLIIPISTAVYGELGVIHYQWHQLEQAHTHFQRAIQVSTLSGYSDAELYYGVVLSRLRQIQGDLDSAARQIHRTVDLMQIEAPEAVREEVIAQYVRVELALDCMAAAEAALKDRGFSFQGTFSYPDLESGQHVGRPIALLYLSAFRILLHRAEARGERARLRQGIELADRLIDGALGHQYIPFALEGLLLRAQMYAALGDERASQVDYVHALELAEPEGFISVFVEEGRPLAEALALLLEREHLGAVSVAYVQRILAAFPAPQPQTASRGEGPALIEPLTDRELEVLSLVAEGLKYGEIAERLYISLNTVRTHVKAIYGKLGVNNRTKAIEIGRKEGLVEN